MTDMVKGLVVTLDQDYRDEDIEKVRKAILMMKGVLAVDLNVRTADDLINRHLIRTELEQKLLKVLK